MYQFNLSLNEILKSVDEAIKIEGIIEDIDKIGTEKTTAIQCKYHEESEKFQWSMVYKPILQMIKTFSGLETDRRNIICSIRIFSIRTDWRKKGIKRYNN